MRILDYAWVLYRNKWDEERRGKLWCKSVIIGAIEEIRVCGDKNRTLIDTGKHALRINRKKDDLET